MFFSIFLTSAIAAVFNKNTVYSVIFLIGCFLLSSSILFLYKSEFVPFLFVVVYVGAIAVLFLFVIMMLETKTKNIKKTTFKYVPPGFYIGIIFLILGLLNNSNLWHQTNNPYFGSIKYNEYTNWFIKADFLVEIKSVGYILYTYYLAFFLISGFLLFLAVLGSVSLTSTVKTKQNLSNLAGIFN
jgi:NADH-quinone oxidoreductase subunit J